MRKLFLKSSLILSIPVLFASCNKSSDSKTQNDQNKAQTEVVGSEEVVTKVVTKEEQAKLTPDLIIKDLKEGNARFAESNMTARNHSDQIVMAREGQYPKAFVLSCIDSRVPVEDVFDQGIGDLFVGRVAGNFANVDLLGSIEYACKVSGTKLVVVLGHESCGAIKGAIDHVELGNLTTMLTNLKPAIEMTNNFAGEKTSKNADYVHEVSVNNVKHTIDYIRKNSSVLKEMEDKGEVKIVGAMYDFHDGAVHFMN